MDNKYSSQHRRQKKLKTFYFLHIKMFFKHNIHMLFSLFALVYDKKVSQLIWKFVPLCAAQ